MKETIKKDHKAWRLYLKLNKAKTDSDKYKALQKISDYFFNQRRENEGKENK